MNITIQPSKSKQAAEITTLLQQSITELCAPDYSNNKAFLDNWLENKTKTNIAK
ncbi:hypothetical protein THERMOT_1622 [Bathymodiolus thermophilus thioautotrophic gill symbiont]|uniref:hypothetical protein n=1 Tax=Bathymodiolus thermophilus thioautotrophic gill symbiont TaxID=2360 RepID=UPI00192A9C84|nr:hypothetical protein [Bathymodiolus thermophilus thioautotrophic gill symbiont]CAB5502466.1 hypothetical protein THERMOT_1622 [Bathymodiolus thermophilus thioautotrophic gill symbiont]